MTQTEVIYSLRAGFRPAEVTQTFLLPNESNCETCTVCTRAPPEGERPAPRPWWAVSSGVEAELELRATNDAPRCVNGTTPRSTRTLSLAQTGLKAEQFMFALAFISERHN